MATAQASKSVTESITYVPGHGDNPTVVWGGHTFRANVAKEITGNPEGSKQEQLNHHIIESARNNRHFEVSGKKKPREAKTTPTNSDEYRKYFIEWMNRPFESCDEMVKRFAQDRQLQQDCEVGTDDYAYLGSLFMPKLQDMALHEELSEGQIAMLFVNHGINQMPW